MSKFKLDVNSIVDIQKGGKVYKSKVQIIKDNFIFIDVPLRKNEYLLLKDKEKVSLVIHEKGGNVYKLNCTTLGKNIAGNIRLYRLSKPHSVQKIQRRDYVRVETTNKIKCLTDKEKFDAILLDLSGGGMRVKITENLKLDDIIYAFIKDKNNNKLKIKGSVVRVEDKVQMEYNVIGVKFVEITNREREAIIQVVFNIMRKQMELI